MGKIYISAVNVEETKIDLALVKDLLSEKGIEFEVLDITTVSDMKDSILDILEESRKEGSIDKYQSAEKIEAYVHKTLAEYCAVMWSIPERKAGLDQPTETTTTVVYVKKKKKKKNKHKHSKKHKNGDN
jgi:hypothetical protein